MTWTAIAAILSYAIAGAMNGAMDKLQFHYGKSIFPKGSQYWDPKLSWRNKYKNGDVNQGPKFPGSTTIFVWLTDGWHLLQTGYLSLQRLAIVLAASSFYQFSTERWENIGSWAVVWLALIWVHAAGFHLTYSVILPKSNKV